LQQFIILLILLTLFTLLAYFVRLAHETWKQANGAMSIARAATMNGVSKSTLRDRINSAIPKKRSKSEDATAFSWRRSPG